MIAKLISAFCLLLTLGACSHGSGTRVKTASNGKWTKAECKQMREELISMTQTYVKTAPCKKDSDCQLITVPIVQVCGGKTFPYAVKPTSKARLDLIASIKDLIYENCQARPEDSNCPQDNAYVATCKEKMCVTKELPAED